MKHEEIIKLASTDIPGVLREAASYTRKVAEENIALEKRAEAAEHELRLVKIARRMEERQLEASLSYDDKLAALRKYTPEKLAQVEAGIEFVTTGGFGAVGDDTHKGTAAMTMDDFVLSGAAYGNS